MSTRGEKREGRGGRRELTKVSACGTERERKSRGGTNVTALRAIEVASIPLAALKHWYSLEKNKNE